MNIEVARRDLLRTRTDELRIIGFGPQLFPWSTGCAIEIHRPDPPKVNAGSWANRVEQKRYDNPQWRIRCALVFASEIGWALLGNCSHRN